MNNYKLEYRIAGQCAYACGRDLNHQDREDIVQESLFKFWKNQYQEPYPIAEIVRTTTIDVRSKTNRAAACLEDLTEIPFRPHHIDDHAEVLDIAIKESYALPTRIMTALLSGVPLSVNDLSLDTGVSKRNIRDNLFHLKAKVQTSLLTTIHDEILRVISHKRASEQSYSGMPSALSWEISDSSIQNVRLAVCRSTASEYLHIISKSRFLRSEAKAASSLFRRVSETIVQNKSHDQIYKVSFACMLCLFVIATARYYPSLTRSRRSQSVKK